MNPSRQVRTALVPVLNGLQSRDGLSVVEINGAMLGMVTRSMEAELGRDRAREFIEDAMANVWGKKPRKPFWRKLCQQSRS